jgi:hypothetical protein
MYKVRSIQKHPSMLRVRHLAPAALIAFVGVSASLGLMGVAMGWLAVAGVLAAWMLTAVAFARRATADNASPTRDVVIAFACLHVAYGLGTWTGLLRFLPRWFINRRGSAPRLDRQVLPSTLQAADATRHDFDRRQESAP